MWEGYCGKAIRRLNRNLGILIVSMAALGALFTYSQRQYLTQYFRGTKAIELSAAAEHPVDGQFVRVHVERAYNTGVQHTTEDRGAEVVDSQYFVTAAGEKLLMLRIPDGGHPREISNLTFEGRLRPLSAEVTKQLPPPPAPLSGYYIDGEDFRGFGTWFLIIGIPLLLLWLFLIVVYQRGATDFTKHPFAKSVGNYGQLEMLMQEIDAETSPAHTVFSWRFNRAEITQNWLLVGTPLALKAMRLNHLVWAYTYVLKRKLYFLVTVQKNYFLIAYDDRGKKVQMTVNKNTGKDVIDELFLRCPNAVFGYDDAIQKIWKRTREKPELFRDEALSLRNQTEPTAVKTRSALMH